MASLVAFAATNPVWQTEDIVAEQKEALSRGEDAKDAKDNYEERELSATVQHPDATPESEDFQVFDDEAAAAPSKLDMELGEAAAGLHGLPDALKKKLAFLGVAKFKQDVEPPVEFEAERDVGPGSDSDLKRRIDENFRKRQQLAAALKDKEIFHEVNTDEYKTARDLVLGDLANDNVPDPNAKPSPPIAKNVKYNNGHLHAINGEATEAAVKQTMKTLSPTPSKSTSPKSGVGHTSWQVLTTLLALVATLVLL